MNQAKKWNVLNPWYIGFKTFFNYAQIKRL
jgi:hypothetical protein